MIMLDWGGNQTSGCELKLVRMKLLVGTKVMYKHVLGFKDSKTQIK